VVDLDLAVGELYALSPEDFTGRRSELEAAAREAGQRDLAKQITALRKPTLAAWLVNALVRDRAHDVQALAPLAEQMRAAHRQLSGQRIRELSAERQEFLQHIVEAAASVSDRTIGDSVLQQVRSTFEAAIADEGAQSAVLSGQLTTALTYTGFGEVDLSEATAVPGARPRLRVVDRQADPTEVRPEATPARRSELPKAPAVDRQSRARATAAAALAEAEQAAAEWAHEVMTSASNLDRAEREYDQLGQKIEDLTQVLEQAKAAAKTAAATLRDRRREHESHTQHHQQAQRRVAEAQRKLDAL